MTQKNKSKRSASGNHHHHHHHSSWRRFKHRVKRWLHKHRWAGFAAVMLVVALLGTAYWMRSDMKNRASYRVSSGRKVDVGGGYRDITYKGQAYRYNNRVTAILYAGIDSEDDIESMGAFTAAPRADSISLIVLDESNAKMSIIALNRDTMTGIHKFTVDGKDRGSFTDHLSLSFAYGDGGKVSCENLVQAVSDLMFGIPISGYVVSNQATLPTLGDAIGPVKVVVPNNDLVDMGFTEGETVTIDGSNLMPFVRTRDITVDQSNVGRMERQQAYIDSAMEKILRLLTQDTNTAWEFIENAEKCVLTDITRNRYLNLVKILKHVQYSQDDYYIPEGEQVVGRVYDEFYPDLDALQEKVIELFYVEH